MSVVLVLIFFSLLVAGGFLAAFLWAVRTGQFDDRFTPSVRILFDNEKENSTINSNRSNN
jgi:cbb3-type cytochrome oxidase maturation protein